MYKPPSKVLSTYVFVSFVCCLQCTSNYDLWSPKQCREFLKRLVVLSSWS